LEWRGDENQKKMKKNKEKKNSFLRLLDGSAMKIACHFVFFAMVLAIDPLNLGRPTTQIRTP
jgi:hypothetical protein